MASYGGVGLGIDLHMEVFGLPRREQVDQYFGIDGYEVKDGGSAGYRITANGRIAGSVVGVVSLAANINAIESLRDGRDHTLVDTLSRVYPNARLQEFRAAGEITTDQDGICSQGYQATWDTWL